MTTNVKETKKESKTNLKDSKKEIVLSANVQSATNDLIVLATKGTNVNEFQKLSAKQCILLNSYLTKKDKHYYPKDVQTDKEQKAYRTYNRSKLKEYIIRLVIKENYVGTLEQSKAIKNFIHCKYNYNILDIDCNSFDYSLIYKNDEFSFCAKIAFLAIQKQLAKNKE